MRLDKIDLNLFIVFEVIYREGNLTKAAKVLNITQPAVSNALARLRKTFDDQLFERKADRMKPTPYAQNLIGPVREALWVLNNGVVSKDSFDPQTARRVVKFSMSDLSSALILPDLISMLRQQAPGIVLESQSIAQNEIVDKLGSSSLEFSIEPPELMDQRLSHEPLMSDSYVCIVRHDHAVHNKTFSLEDYLALDHIHTSSRSEGVGHIDSALNIIGKKRKVKVRLPNHLIALNMVQDTDLALTIDAPEMALHLYWHTGKDEEPGNKWLRELLLKHFAST